MEVCHGKKVQKLRRSALLLKSRASVANLSLPKRKSSAVIASFMATSNSSKSWAATIRARADQDAGFKRCCMDSGNYDGVLRDYYF